MNASRHIIGTRDAILAEFASEPFEASAYTAIELRDDEVIAVAGYKTLNAAISEAEYYGVARKDIEFYLG